MGVGLKESGTSRYLKSQCNLQIHYNNELRSTNVFDSSGIRIFFTEKLRPHEGGEYFKPIKYSFYNIHEAKKTALFLHLVPFIYKY